MGENVLNAIKSDGVETAMIRSVIGRDRDSIDVGEIKLPFDMLYYYLIICLRVGS